MSICVTNKIYNFGRFHLSGRFKYSLIISRSKKYIPVYNNIKVSRKALKQSKESTQHTSDNKSEAGAIKTNLEADNDSRVKDVLNLKYSLPTTLTNIYNLFHTINNVNNKPPINAKNAEPNEDDISTNTTDVREIYLNIFLKVDIRRRSLRDNLLLPFNVKNKKKILVVCDNEHIDIMIKNGAAYAGLSHLDKIENNWRDFDLILTSFIFMPKLVKLARILGPLKLMPNAKSGTLCNNLLGGLKKLSSNNSIQYRAEPITADEYDILEKLRKIISQSDTIDVDKGGLSKIKIPISLLSNTKEQLKTNIQFFIQHLMTSVEDVNVKEKKEVDFVYPPPRNLFGNMGIGSSGISDKGGKDDFILSIGLNLQGFEDHLFFLNTTVI